MIESRKQRISDAFGAAAGHYDEHAGPQRVAAERVAALALAGGPAARRILEIGCGTGLLTRRIPALWSGADIVATDLSPSMVAQATRMLRGVATFRAMDGEWPGRIGAPFDLILSNLTFQWFGDLNGAVGRLMALLRPGGRIVFSTMGQGSLAQWRVAHGRCGLESGVADYPAVADLERMLACHGVAHVDMMHVPLEPSGAAGLLRHLRGIGAVVPDMGRRPIGAGALRRVMAAYDSGGGRDDYVILFGQVRKA